ncbi:MAG TPA: aromatic ring-hydroxylating dioxygenase subunit alpha [Steroidobacteraceae bacterium]
MTTKHSAVRRDPGYLGLTRSVAALPAADYFDAVHYQRELSQIWYRNWLYVGRSSEVREARSFRIFTVGDQSVLLVRAEDQVLRAFYNTCRHRGAALCQGTYGRLPAAGIVCPYHAWRYNLRGDLVRTTSRQHADDFDPGAFSLYGLPVTEWNGCIFVALTQKPPPFEKSFDLPIDRLDAWRMGTLVVGHRSRKVIECNWKIFWENYNECLHCPGVHPQLAQLVPLFGRALLEPKDDPQWQDHAADKDPRYAGGLRPGATSWTLDGNPVGVPFPNLTDEDRKSGHLYLTGLPSIFIVAHLDYMRIVRLLPLGPERTEMSIEFLFLPETLADPQRDISGAVEFTQIVMGEDAQICELNQRGLHALAHQGGVLMPEEYVIQQFQAWIRSELARL